ncbi:MAG TPA: hypothetical protein VGB73_08435 [Pyrinomonadaceae bacterium]|jgi:hypothetical protein
MSEPKRWVGYADLLEAKRRREEREEQDSEPSVPALETLPAPQIPPPPPSDYVVENQIDTGTTGVTTPVTAPVATPVITPVTTPVEANVDENPSQFQSLDATHTGSEQRVYSVMYRETISKGVRERHFGPAELIRKTGIRSDRTIRTAIRGLIQKFSIEIVSNSTGSPLGPKYRVFEPKEIVRRRRAAGLKIDPQSKKIVGAEETTEDATPVATGVTTGVATPVKITGVTPVDFTGVTPVDFTGVYKYVNSSTTLEGATASSSSKSFARDPDDDDETFLDSLRGIYERATGNAWTTADAVTAQRARDIPLEVWGIAICYCVDRAPGHKFDRLAYVLEEARRHREEMRDFSKEDLKLILLHSLRQIERARSLGRWEPATTREEENP